MLYLYARFAYKQCSESWLEELLEGAVDRIEGDVYVSSHCVTADYRKISRIYHILHFGRTTRPYCCIY